MNITINTTGYEQHIFDYGEWCKNQHYNLKVQEFNYDIKILIALIFIEFINYLMIFQSNFLIERCNMDEKLLVLIAETLSLFKIAVFVLLIIRGLGML